MLSSIVYKNRYFLCEVQCKLADAQFIPHYIRERLRRPVYGAQSAPCHRIGLNA